MTTQPNFKKITYLIVFYFTTLTLQGCVTSKIFIEKSYDHYQVVNKSYSVNNEKYIPKTHHNIHHHEEFGIASWYTTKKFPKAITASGDIFNPNALTSAHKTLPFMSVVRITSLDNNKTIDVVINDRGPFIKNRIIDLSEGAAKILGFKKKGIVNVKVQYLTEETEALKNKITVKNKNKNKTKKPRQRPLKRKIKKL